MKDLFMLLVITIVCKATVSSSIKSVEWEDFKTQFGKTYDNEEEELFRLQIFNRNKQKMEKHNAEYEQGVHTFTMGMNQFSDMDIHEFSILMNGFNKSRGIAMLEDERELFVSSSNIKIPLRVDWREIGAVTEVKDQGVCGSCWAFSSTGALEGQVFRSTGKIISLSEQNLMDCSVDYGTYGCDGGFMDAAFEYVRDNGILPEVSYPYEAQVDNCRFNDFESVATVTELVNIPKGKENALQEAVTIVGPISVAIDANHESFMHYKEGVFYEELCSSTRVNHGVLIVGYGTDEKHGDYWLVKNSWSKSWGMDGYVKMARNRGNNCGIATMASYPNIQLTLCN